MWVYYCMNPECAVIKYAVNPDKYTTKRGKRLAFECPACDLIGEDSGDV